MMTTIGIMAGISIVCFFLADLSNAWEIQKLEKRIEKLEKKDE